MLASSSSNSCQWNVFARLHFRHQVRYTGRLMDFSRRISRMSINATTNRMNDLHDVDHLVDQKDHGEDVRAQAAGLPPGARDGTMTSSPRRGLLLSCAARRP